MRYDTGDPLARLRGESKKANQALRDYCLMGPGRSLRNLLALYRDQSTTARQPPTRRLSTLRSWSSKYEWQARLSGWAAMKQAQDEAEWDKRRDEFRRRAYELAWAGLDKFGDMLDWPLQETEVIEVDDEGRPTVVKIEPGPWNYTSAAKLLAESNKVALLALGEVTESTEQRHTGGIAVAIGSFAGMEDDELNDTIHELMDRFAAGGPGTVGGPPDGTVAEGEAEGD